MNSGAGTVLIIEDDPDLASSYEMTLGLMVPNKLLVLNDLDSVLKNADEALACEVALIDVDLGHGKPSGLDVYQWLRKNGFQGKVYFVTGHARTHPAVVKAVEVDHVALLQKPVDLDLLIETITSGKLHATST